MQWIVCVVFGLIGFVPLQAFAQTVASPPSAPKTKLEAFGTQGGVVIVERFSTVGEIEGVDGIVRVRATEFTHAATGRREIGIVIQVQENRGLKRSNRSFVDYDEIAGLLKGLEYLGKVDNSAKRFDGFRAYFLTKDDLRISIASSGSPDDDDMLFISSGHVSSASVLLKSLHLGVLRSLISSAKEKLDAVK